MALTTVAGNARCDLLIKWLSEGLTMQQGSIRWLIVLLLIGMLSQTGSASASDVTPHSGAQAKDQCINCHAEQVQAWQSSSHAWSMRRADTSSVLGNFDNQVYRSDALEATFIHNDQGFFVRLTEGSEGLVSWRVEYIFGVYPLQQYLIQTGNGRLQALNIAWDSRSQAEGGQRWFRLDAASHPAAGDALHWQGVYQNWNSQCASCHSTGLEKNYDHNNKQYTTNWSQINVGCTACHGKPDAHLQRISQGKVPAASDFALNIDAVGIWLQQEDKHTALNSSRDSTAQLQVCAGCHSLRTQLSEGNAVTTGYTDKFSLERLKPSLYFADGQVKEEVFVYGSFLQSKMHHNGVVCSNCHEPHSLRLKLPGNSLCTQCHKAQRFDTPQHHHHSGEGSGCIDCHMPERTFMVIDGRRDHSFRIPRPDLSKKYGSPDVCTGCHSDHNLDWAVEAIAQWYPDRLHKRHWSEWRNEDDIELLITILADQSQPALVRSTLMEFRGEQLARQNPEVIDKLMTDKAPLIRESAYRIARYMPDQERNRVWQGVTDEVRAVRFAAYESAVLTGLVSEKANAKQDEQQINSQVAQEYQQFLSLQSDTPAGLALNGRYWRALGETARAEKSFHEAIELDRDYLPALLELVDLYRQTARIKEALLLLEISVERNPENALVHHLLGLVRLKELNYDGAIKALADAARLESKNLLYGYRYAVVLNELGKSREATIEVNRLLQIYPDQETVRSLLMIIERSQ
ncbi:MAG: tetratricopeptide repeat protein [Amphritea sp.]